MINPKILIIIVAILIAILLFQLYNDPKNNVENYTDLKMEYEILNSLEAAEDGNFGEYRRLNTIYPRGVWRHKELNANKWETRLPSLVKHRYSFNDCPTNQKLPGIKGAARLKELPLNLKNRWGSVLDGKIARTSLEYYPDVDALKIGDKSNQTFGHIANDNKIYSSYRTVAPFITDTRPNKLDTPHSPFGSPYVIDSPQDYQNLSKMISGYNPSDSLPAQYADRSKSSIEYLLTADLIKERMDEPVYGWLPEEK